jgi:hypothetical protein
MNMDKVFKFILLTIFSALVFALGANHYKRCSANLDAKPPIRPGNIVMEQIPNDFEGRGQLFYQGRKFEILRSIHSGNIEDAMKKIERDAIIAGFKPLGTPPKVLESIMTRDKKYDFNCFVAPNKTVRGCLFDSTPSGILITSVEFDLSSKGNSMLASAPELPYNFRDVMFEEPSLYLQHNTDKGTGIYTCTSNEELGRVFTQQKNLLLDKNWKLDPAGQFADKLPSAEKDTAFLIAEKNGFLCHVMMKKSEEKLILSYRFSESKIPLVSY